MRVLKVDTFYKKYAYLFDSVRMLRQPVIFQIIIEIEVLRIYFHVNKTGEYPDYRIELQIIIFFYRLTYSIWVVGFFFRLFPIGPSLESDFIGFICKTVKIIVNCTIRQPSPYGIIYGIICKGGCLILFISVEGVTPNATQEINPCKHGKPVRKLQFSKFCPNKSI